AVLGLGGAATDGLVALHHRGVAGQERGGTRWAAAVGGPAPVRAGARAAMGPGPARGPTRAPAADARGRAGRGGRLPAGAGGAGGRSRGGEDLEHPPGWGRPGPGPGRGVGPVAPEPRR